MTTRTSIAGRWRAVAGVLVASSLLLVTACTGGGTTPGPTAAPVSSGPPTTASGSSSAAPSSTPSASYKPADASGKALNVPVPELPEAAKAETKEGLEAFARYWYSAITCAYQTGDVGPLERISSASCVSCGRVKEVVQGWHSEGRWLAGGAMLVEGAQSTFIESGPARYQVLIQVRQEALYYYRADKTLEEKAEPSPAIGDIMIATYGAEGWTAVSVEHLTKNP